MEAKLQHVSVVMSWGDHWPLSWSIRIFCAGLQAVTWISVSVCWWNWLSHVYDICTFASCGCLVYNKICNKQILWIPLCILSIYFSIWRDNKLVFDTYISQDFKGFAHEIKGNPKSRTQDQMSYRTKETKEQHLWKDTYRRESLSTQQCTLQWNNKGGNNIFNKSYVNLLTTLGLIFIY